MVLIKLLWLAEVQSGQKELPGLRESFSHIDYEFFVRNNLFELALDERELADSLFSLISPESRCELLLLGMEESANLVILNFGRLILRLVKGSHNRQFCYFGLRKVT